MDWGERSNKCSKTGAFCCSTVKLTFLFRQLFSSLCTVIMIAFNYLGFTLSVCFVFDASDLQCYCIYTTAVNSRPTSSKTAFSTVTWLVSYVRLIKFNLLLCLDIFTFFCVQCLLRLPQPVSPLIIYAHQQHKKSRS